MVEKRRLGSLSLIIALGASGLAGIDLIEQYLFQEEIHSVGLRLMRNIPTPDLSQRLRFFHRYQDFEFAMKVGLLGSLPVISYLFDPLINLRGIALFLSTIPISFFIFLIASGEIFAPNISFGEPAISLSIAVVFFFFVHLKKKVDLDGR